MRHSDFGRKKDLPLQLAVAVLHNSRVGILSSGWGDGGSQQIHELSGSPYPKPRTVV